MSAAKCNILQTYIYLQSQQAQRYAAPLARLHINANIQFVEVERQDQVEEMRALVCHERLAAFDLEYRNDPPGSMLEVICIATMTCGGRSFLMNLMLHRDLCESFLREVLPNKNVTKLFHDVRNDARYLMHRQIALTNVIDTQVAWAVVAARDGAHNLVMGNDNRIALTAALYDVQMNEADAIDKTQQCSDFSLDPLPYGQKVYSVTGTKWLIDLCMRLSRKPGYNEEIIRRLTAKDIEHNAKGGGTGDYKWKCETRRLPDERSQKLYDVLRLWRGEVWMKCVNGNVAKYPSKKDQFIGKAVMSNGDLHLLATYTGVKKPIRHIICKSTEYVYNYEQQLSNAIGDSWDGKFNHINVI
jgi:hypothetical protein